MLSLTALVLAGAVSVSALQSPPQKVTNLPGWTDTSFDMYAGYITVDDTPGKTRKLFYWLQRAKNSTTSPASGNKVLGIWQSGGPGCSSVGGMMTEMGAFYAAADGSLKANDWSWNNNVDMIYVESPAGVGFSYSEDPGFYQGTTDEETAQDLWVFAQGILEQFPEYSGYDWYLTGESYGGHYVPNYAKKILDQNQAKAGKNIPLKGFAVGNAWTVPADDNRGAADFWHQHAIISDEVYGDMIDNCNFSNIGPIARDQQTLRGAGSAVDPAKCNNAVNTAFDAFNSINIYDVYVDVCTAGDGSAPDTAGWRLLKARFPEAAAQSEARIRQAGQARRMQQTQDGAADPGPSNYPNGGPNDYEPCIDSYTAQYLNRKDVQEAIHANTDLGYAWTDCSPRVQYSRESLLSSVSHLYRDFMKAGLDVTVYSGDIDGIVPVTGTRRWIRGMNFTVEDPWKAWLLNGQTGGFVTQYEQGFRLVTVRGAGHMCPQTQRDRSLSLWHSSVFGTKLGDESLDL